MNLMPGLHLLAGMYWVGGLIFLFSALSPAVEEVLEPTERLPLMHRVLQRFFPLALLAVAAMLVTGYGLLEQPPGSGMGWLAVSQLGIGILSAAFLTYAYLLVLRGMGEALEKHDLAHATSKLDGIRGLLGVCLLLALAASLLGIYGGLA